MRQMRTLLRRYPDFADVRAALAAALWAAGKEGEAETTWERVEDARWARVHWRARVCLWRTCVCVCVRECVRVCEQAGE